MYEIGVSTFCDHMLEGVLYHCSGNSELLHGHSISHCSQHLQDERKLAEARAEWAALAGDTRVVSVRGLSVGEWHASRGVVAMTTMRGPHFRTVGMYDRDLQTTVLRPEEAIFLMDRGVIEVHWGE